jgi:glycosyltransferase domain-containing protein
MTSKITLLLTLKGRIDYTYRWIRYAQHQRFPFDILIADGGNDQEIVEFFAEKANYQPLNVNYVRYPYDANYSMYYSKIVDGLSKVQTPYVAMADNDDFYSVQSIEQSVAFLESHPDYSSCRGQMPCFEVISSDRLYGKQIHYFFNKSMPNCSEGSLERVLRHFTPYDPTYYDIHRTPHLYALFQKQREYDIQDLYLAELFTSFLTIASGKVHRLDSLYLLRQSNSTTSSARDEVAKKGSHFHRLFLNSWSADFSAFINEVSQVISQRDGISIDQSRDFVKQGYINYIAPIVASDISRLATGPRKDVQKQILSGLGPLLALHKAFGKIRRKFSTNQSLGRTLSTGDIHHMRIIERFLGTPPTN